MNNTVVPNISEPAIHTHSSKNYIENAIVRRSTVDGPMQYRSRPPGFGINRKQKKNLSNEMGDIINIFFLIVNISRSGAVSVDGFTTVRYSFRPCPPVGLLKRPDVRSGKNNNVFTLKRAGEKKKKRKNVQLPTVR